MALLTPSQARRLEAWHREHAPRWWLKINESQYEGVWDMALFGMLLYTGYQFLAHRRPHSSKQRTTK